MLNNNISLCRGQAISQDYVNIVYWMGGILSDEHDSVERITEKQFTEKTRRILDDVLRHIALFPKTYICQQGIASRVGCTREFVNKRLGLLEKLGVIVKTTRINNTCLYTVGEFLMERKVMWSLQSILPNLYRAYKELKQRSIGIVKKVTKLVRKVHVAIVHKVRRFREDFDYNPTKSVVDILGGVFTRLKNNTLGIYNNINLTERDAHAREKSQSVQDIPKEIRKIVGDDVSYETLRAQYESNALQEQQKIDIAKKNLQQEFMKMMGL
jgi:DNA-binding Lrp family transcriptional regulator